MSQKLKEPYKFENQTSRMTFKILSDLSGKKQLVVLFQEDQP